MKFTMGEGEGGWGAVWGWGGPTVKVHSSVYLAIEVQRGPARGPITSPKG